MRYISVSFLLAILPACLASPTTRKQIVNKRQDLTHGAGETPYCTWWQDTVEGDTCNVLAEMWDVTVEDFKRWNPSITDAECSGGLKPDYSYCVEAKNEPKATSTTTAPTLTSTTAPSPTSNGVATPTPFQSGMTKDCHRFYKVQKDDNCAAIISAAGISEQNFHSWNPAVKDDCSVLWADTYVCIGITEGSVDPTPTTTEKPSTETATPFPMVPFPDDGLACHLFEWVSRGDTCNTIIQKASISAPDFYYWNPSVKNDCTGLQANTYVCIRGDPRPTTVQPAPTGVATPSPIQSGMVSNCKTFYFVKQGDTCDTISKARGISVANFTKWNPAVGSNCSGMWANTYACVGI